MNRDELIKLALEDGFIVDKESQKHQPNCIFHTWHLIDEGLERFATLVAAAEREVSNVNTVLTKTIRKVQCLIITLKQLILLQTSLSMSNINTAKRI